MRRSIAWPIILTSVIAVFSSVMAAQGVPPQPIGPASALLNRDYNLGETLEYEMKGNNSGWEYQIRSTNLVKRDGAGVFYEEIGWSICNLMRP